MARYKKFDYTQTELIPIPFDEQILEGSFEYTLDYLIENRIDMTVFDHKYRNDITGAPAYDPRIMLKIILYCYSKGIYSSREIEYFCRTNIIVKALSANTMPHFTSIAEFVSSMKEEIYPVFLNILMVCSEMDLIGGDMFALDGCKFSSNASKEWSGTFSNLQKKKEKIEKIVEKMIQEQVKLDNSSELDVIKKSKEMQSRIQKLEKKAEKIEHFLATESPKMKSRSRRGEKQSNITDNESAKMKTSRGMVQGFNGLSVVDSKHQVVVYPEAFGSGPEGEFLKGMVRKTKVMLKQDLINTVFTADTNYFSERNLKYLANHNVRAVIPDTQYRQRDSRYDTANRHKPPKKKQFGIADFTFIPEKNVYICKNNQEVRYRYDHEIRGIKYGKYICRPSACGPCSYRSQCLKTDKVRYRTLQKPLHEENRNYCSEMKDFIDSKEGRDLYGNRLGIVEPVFGNIRACKRLDRFTLRGKKKCNIQWVLMNIIHNIGKIQVYGSGLS